MPLSAHSLNAIEYCVCSHQSWNTLGMSVWMCVARASNSNQIMCDIINYSIESNICVWGHSAQTSRVACARINIALKRDVHLNNCCTGEPRLHLAMRQIASKCCRHSGCSRCWSRQRPDAGQNERLIKFSCLLIVSSTALHTWDVDSNRNVASWST